MAIVCWKGEVITVTNKLTKKSFRKQDVRIIDQSNTAVYLTVWAEMASTEVKVICKSNTNRRFRFKDRIIQ